MAVPAFCRSEPASRGRHSQIGDAVSYYTSPGGINERVLAWRPCATSDSSDRAFPQLHTIPVGWLSARA